MEREEEGGIIHHEFHSKTREATASTENTDTTPMRVQEEKEKVRNFRVRGRLELPRNRRHREMNGPPFVRL